MKTRLLLLATAVAMGFGSPAEAQNRIQYGTANSTPYYVPRFQPGPMPGYVRNLGQSAARRYVAPFVGRYYGPTVQGLVRGGSALGAAGGGVMFNFTNPSRACAMGRNGQC